MPIGKDSIRKRVIGSDCAACGVTAGRASFGLVSIALHPFCGKIPS
mgnify:CR=1 FL=1